MCRRHSRLACQINPLPPTQNTKHHHRRKQQKTKLNPFLRGLLRAGVELRTRVRWEPYGDQALWARRGCLESLGGFKDWPLLEDLDLVRRLGRSCGPPAVVGAAVETSGRRWSRLGFWQTWWRNQRVLAAHASGVGVEELSRMYREG